MVCFREATRELLVLRGKGKSLGPRPELTSLEGPGWGSMAARVRFDSLVN